MMNILQKMIKVYKSIDRRSPIQIELDRLKKLASENMEEVEQYLKQSKRFKLVDKHHQYCGIHDFDILDIISGKIYKNISYSGVFIIVEALEAQTPSKP